MYGFSSARYGQHKLLAKKKLYQLVMEITNDNDQPLQNSRQNSVFWRGAECHCQVAEFLLHTNKK
jgi:hypothetical protein